MEQARRPLQSDLELQFAIRYVYVDTKSNTLRDGRATKWRAQKKSTIQLNGQSLSAPVLHKQSCIFAEALAARKSSLVDLPPMASGKWPVMCASPFNTAPTSQSIPLYPQSQRGEKVMTAAEVRTVTETVVVCTVTVIVNQVVMVMQH